jgi:hypothetical protein
MIAHAASPATPSESSPPPNAMPKEKRTQLDHVRFFIPAGFSVGSTGAI